MWALWVVLGLVALVVIFGIVSYNRFVSQRQLIKDAWANIDTELRRRYDLIPNLIETVRGYAAHERTVFENVTRARAAAAAATGSPAEQAAAEGPFVAALRQLFAVVENYPDLKANQNFLALQGELTNTEDRLQTSRRFYNANVRDYNQRVQQFPSMIVAQHVQLQGRGVLRGRGGASRGGGAAGELHAAGAGGFLRAGYGASDAGRGGIDTPDAATAAGRRRPVGRSGDRVGTGQLGLAGEAVAVPRGPPTKVGGQQRPRTGIDDRSHAETNRRDALAERGGRPCGHEARDREAEGDEPVVEREDPPADPIGHDALQPVGRQRPLCPPAEVRDRNDRAVRASEGMNPNAAYPRPKTASAAPIAPNSLRSPGPAAARPRNGPMSAPTPRAAISTPMPIAPAPNTSSANTEISTMTPAVRPNPAFTDNSARFGKAALEAGSNAALNEEIDARST